MMKRTAAALRTIFSQSLYRYISIGASLLVAYASYWLFYKTTTIATYVENIKNGDFGKYSLLYGTTYLASTFLIIIVSGISVAVAVWLHRHAKLGAGKSASANLGGLTTAMFAMGCPVCGAFLLSAIGVAGGLAVLPLKGLELKILSLGLLAGATLYGASKVSAADCEACVDVRRPITQEPGPKKLVILPLQKVIMLALAPLLLVNQLLIGQVSAGMGMMPGNSSIVGILGVKAAAASIVIAPKLSPDGKTTTLVEQPTITGVPANPNTGDAVADARLVMIPTGKPFYAPDDISFDDPITAQNKWGALEDSIALAGNEQRRYNDLINMFTCNYCCGGPTQVTVIARCGCRHAKAWRGMFKYLLQTYGDTYTNEQLMGEAYRWTGIWYPKGVLEDYLLATGRGDVLGHQTHGGAGSDGRHGL